MFSKTSLQQLKDRVDLVEFIGSYLPLKRTGHVYKACCPFHEEKSPSFQVQAGAQHYHCFGCGAHGDAFSFAMHQLGLSFTDAASALADRYHIALEKHQESEQDQERERAVELMNQAQLFFVWCFWNHPQAQAAREYLRARGIEEEFCRRFGMGYCPQSHGLREYLRSLRFRDEEMEKLGLINSAHRDFFSQRITFPITDYRSQVIAFSARKYQESTYGGKYINSPETILYKKSKTLFGLSYCRMRLAKEKQAILVEGQLDTLRLIESGFNFTVAALGTAFGVDHAQMLKRLGVQRVWILFDGDSAGREAASKVGDLLMRQSLEVRVALLDEGDDPDSLLGRDNGVEQLVQKLDQAIAFVDFWVQHRSRGKDLRSPAVKSALIQSLREQIEQWEDPILVYEALRALARALCIPESLVLGAHKRPHHARNERALKGGQLLAPPDHLIGDTVSNIQSSWIKQHSVLEADLLRWLLAMGPSHPALIEYCAGYLTREDFMAEPFQQLWDVMLMRYRERRSALDFASAMIDLEPDLGACVQELGEKKIDARKMVLHIQQTIQELVRRRTMHRAEALRLEIQSGRLSDAEAMEKAQGYAAIRKQVPHVESFEPKLEKEASTQDKSSSSKAGAS